MSYHTPPGWAERCTMRDDRAMHQIRIYGATSKGLPIGCTCAVGPIDLAYFGEDVMQVWRDAKHKPQAAKRRAS